LNRVGPEGDQLFMPLNFAPVGDIEEEDKE
jgi:hypothetical protein